MAFRKFGRILTALVASAALGLGMTACGGGTIGYLWVPSTYYNQINGFKIDDYTGNLTPILDQPFSAAGSNPQLLIVRNGGRFVYVINSGTGEVGTPGSANYKAPQSSGIEEYSVGGGGVLTHENHFDSQGYHPVWAATDGSGNFLYVVDRYSPAYNGTTDLNGSVTAFAIASDTGRLTLVTNQAILKPGTNIPTTYFEVAPNPVMLQAGNGGCLYSLSPTQIYPYSLNSSTGQLTVVNTGAYVVPAPLATSTLPNPVTPNLTSINVAGSAYTFLTDAANNYIYALQAGGTPCSFVAVNGGSIQNFGSTVTGGTVNPVNSLTSSSGTFLYVLNNNTNGQGTQQTANSTISAFSINGTGTLMKVTDNNSNPYAVGSGPVCLVFDPTHQYMYVSDNQDGTLTGKVVDITKGTLSDLRRGSSFTVSKNPTCLAISPNL